MQEGAKEKESPLRGRYLVQNRLVNFFLRFVDLLSFSSFPSIQSPPEKILLTHIAHLGDVVIATCLIPHLKKLFPQAKIGFLLASWSKPILEGHPLVDYLHTVDHWKLNRSSQSLWKRILQYISTRSKAIREIKAIGYTLALDLYFYFPNAIFLLWQARIPIRVGYTSGGFGSFLTHPVLWINKNQHISAYYQELLDMLPFTLQEKLSFLPSLPSISSHIQEKAESKLPSSFWDQGFIVFHMGAGHHLKEWPEGNWQMLAHLFLNQGYKLVFTGKGEKERKKIDAAMPASSHSFNAADVLNWKEFTYLIQKCLLLISVDSAAAHIASTFETPAVILYTGMNQISHWKPPYIECISLTHPVPCAPCYNKRGCKDMSCIRTISATEVLQKAKELLLQKQNI